MKIQKDPEDLSVYDWTDWFSTILIFSKNIYHVLEHNVRALSIITGSLIWTLVKDSTAFLNSGKKMCCSFSCVFANNLEASIVLLPQCYWASFIKANL